MSRDFFDPPWDQTNIVLVDEEMLRQAQRQIRSCETCTPNMAQIPFDWVLDKLTGNNPSTTDYVLSKPATCPRCQGSISEKTLVDLRDDSDEEDSVTTPLDGQRAIT